MIFHRGGQIGIFERYQNKALFESLRVLVLNGQTLSLAASGKNSDRAVQRSEWNRMENIKELIYGGGRLLETGRVWDRRVIIKHPLYLF